jgi:Zn-dependent protease
LLLLLPQLAGADPRLVITFLVGVFVAVLLGMTVHEFAHNYVGYLMGDPTPARQGRLTLNPLVHINPAGFLMFMILGFGPLGSAPISAYRMRNPRWGYLLAVAAGPFSNLLIAIVFALIIRVLDLSPFQDRIQYLFFSTVVLYNVLLFIFNLLPLYPIDGWHIVLSLLPADLAIQWERHAQTTQLIFFGLLLLSFVNLPFDPLGIIIYRPLFAIMQLLGVGFGI